jgi:hypothetical protein
MNQDSDQEFTAKMRAALVSLDDVQASVFGGEIAEHIEAVRQYVQTVLAEVPAA